MLYSSASSSFQEDMQLDPTVSGILAHSKTPDKEIILVNIAMPSILSKEGEEKEKEGKSEDAT